MLAPVRPYLYYDIALSIGTRCYAKVEGKIVFQDGNVYLLSNCPGYMSRKVLRLPTISNTIADAARSFLSRRRCRFTTTPP